MAMEASSTITLSDVAQAAGVSVSTASRALNGLDAKYRISRSTAEEVRRVAGELGFRPNQAARAFRSQRSGLVGVVVPDIANPFFAAIAREVTLAAEQHQYSILIADSQESTLREQNLLQEFVSRQVEALVVCPVGVECQHLVAIHQSNLPLVLVDRVFPQCEMMQVTSQHRTGAQLAAELLLANGHRHIGVLQGLPGTLPNDERLQGLRETLHSVGIPFDSEFVDGNNFTEVSGYESATRLLSRHPEITAFFALSTPNALGALRASAGLGRSVPDDLSIMTFDDSPFADFMRIPLSTVCQDVQKLGEHAASIVVSALRDGKMPPPTLQQFQVTVVQRSSIESARL